MANLYCLGIIRLSPKHHYAKQGGQLRGHLLCQNTCKGLAIHYAFFRGSAPLVIHREDLGA